MDFQKNETFCLSNYFFEIRVFDVVSPLYYLFYFDSTCNHFICVRNYVIPKLLIMRTI